MVIVEYLVIFLRRMVGWYTNIITWIIEVHYLHILHIFHSLNAWCLLIWILCKFKTCFGGRNVIHSALHFPKPPFYSFRFQIGYTIPCGSSVADVTMFLQLNWLILLDVTFAVVIQRNCIPKVPGSILERVRVSLLRPSVILVFPRRIYGLFT
jgi:hypothetical protein